jgi:uncharacterized protein
MDLSYLQYALAALAAFAGEMFGSIFGGGGFLIQPSLLAIGIPSRLVIANDVTSAAFACWAFVWYFQRKTRVDTKAIGWMAPALIIGAFIGGHLLSVIPEQLINWLILLICLLGLVYTLLRIKKPMQHHHEHGQLFKHWQFFSFVIALLLGFYDGISGAGGGILMIAALSLMFRANMKSTLGTANLLSAISLSAAGLTYWYLGLLDYGLLLAMVPAAIVAGIFAAQIVHVVSEKHLRVGYACILSALLVYLVINQI